MKLSSEMFWLSRRRTISVEAEAIRKASRNDNIIYARNLKLPVTSSRKNDQGILYAVSLNNKKSSQTTN